MKFAKEFSDKHGQRLGMLALAVTGDAELARKQHADLHLPFPILDGNGMHLTFGVDATPRLIVIDVPTATCAGAITGWGLQTPREINDELACWLPKQ